MNSLVQRVLMVGIVFLLGAGGALGQSASYSIQGTLSDPQTGGTDPLNFKGQDFSVSTSLGAPTSVSTTSGSSTATFSPASITLAAPGHPTLPGPFTCNAATVVITDSATGSDRLQFGGCSLPVSNWSGSLTLPAGTLVTSAPAAFSSTSVTGSVGYASILGSGRFDLESTSMSASGSAPPSASASPSQLSFAAESGGPAPATQAVTFTTSPDYPRSYSVSRSGTWLSVTPNSGNTSAGLTVSVAPGSLAAGTYDGSITVDFGQGSSTNIPVEFTLTSPEVTLSVSPTSLTFDYQKGGSTPSPKNVSVTSSPESTSITAAASTTSGGNWLSVSPATGDTPQDLSVSVANLDALTEGSYSGTITVNGDGATNNPRTVPVTLNVTVPDLTVSPASLSFEYTIGQAAPSSKTFSLTSSVPVSFSASESTSWFSVAPTSGTANTSPQNVTVSVDTSGLTTPGTLNGNITVSAPGATNKTVAVSITVTKPALTVNPSAMTFNHTIGTSDPPNQTFTVSSTPAVDFTATPATSSGGNWLSVSPTSGNGSGTLTVSVNPTGLTAGNYSGTVTVSAPGADDKTVGVTLNVTAPTITVSPTSLNFGYQINGAVPPAQNVNVSTTPSIAFNAVASTSSGGNWLAVSPSSGNGSANLSVSVDPAGLTAGTYNGTVTVSATGADSKTVNVTLSVSSSPTLTVSPGSLTFNYQDGGSNPPSQAVNVTASTPVAFTASASGGSWMSVTPGSGNTPGTLTVSVDPSGLSPGTYNGSISIASTEVGNSPQTVAVELIVSAAPTISVSPSQMSFTHQIGGVTPTSRTVSVSGTSPLAFTASTSGGSWLAVTPGSGNTPATLNVSVDPSGLSQGTYNGMVTVTSAGASNSPQSVAVTLTVTPAADMTVSPSLLTFAYQIGGETPDSRTVSVSATPSIPFSVSVSGGNWLSVTPGSGNTNGTLTVSADPSNLSPGTYNGTITVSSASASNSPQTVGVSLTVTAAPTIGTSPSSMSFNLQNGGSAPPVQLLNVTTTPAGPFSAAASTSTGGNWLSVSPASGTGAATLNVSVTAADNLSPGSYNGTITISSVGVESESVSVTLTVSDQPALNVSPIEISFTYDVDGPEPDAQTISVAASETLAFTAMTSGGDWLSVTPSSGDAGSTPVELSVAVDPAGLEPGTYEGTVTITAPGAGNSPVVVAVTLTVALAEPSFDGRDVVNHATLQQGAPVASGGLASVFGDFPGAPLESAPGLPLPPNLSGVEVKLRDKPAGDAGNSAAVDYVTAPLLFVSAEQIGFQVPWEISVGTAEMIVSVNGSESQPADIPIAETSPGIFMDTVNFSSPFPAIAFAPDGTLAWPAGAIPEFTTRPVKIGEPLVILATGLGPVTGPPPVNGEDSLDENGEWIRRDTVTTPTVMVGGQPAEVFFAGLSPQFVGVYQINLTEIPATVQPGSAVPLVIEMNGVRSREDVVIAVDPAQ